MDNITQYIDKLFFYCLKKTGNRYDAEELSSQIVLEVLLAIKKNIQIENMEAYIFTVANNQYNRYMKNKINKKEHETYIDNSIIESYASDESIINKIYKEDQYNNARIQIQTLSSEYLQILYGYYIEDKTIKTIANEMHLPLGTVNRKLFELRNKLMEGIKMERLNGKKAYIPTDYDIVQWGHSSINYRHYVENLLTKNLLAHAYDNPCTLEDFALELGVSMPYIEDFVNGLSGVNFLKEVNKGMFITNLAFITNEFKDKIMSYLNVNSKIFLEKIRQFCKTHLNDFRKMANAEMDDKLLMWSLMFYVYQICENRLPYKYTYEFVGNGYQCDFAFIEKTKELKFEKPLYVAYSWNHGYNPETKLHYYCWPGFTSDKDNMELNKLCYPNSIQGYELTHTLLKTLYGANNKKLSDLDEKTREKVLDASQENYVQIIDDVVKFNCIYLPEQEYRQLIAKIDDDEMINELAKELEKIADGVNTLVKNYLPNYLHSRIKCMTRIETCRMRSFVVNYFLEKQEIIIPDDDKKFVYCGIFWERDNDKKW